MKEYVITEEQLAAIELSSHESGMGVCIEAEHIRSNPLSEHDAEIAKKERDIVLREILKVIAGQSVLMNGTIVLPTRDFTDRIISMLGDEP